MRFFKKIQDGYNKLNIQKKLSIIVVTAVTIPMLLIIVIFSGRLFNMITSDTIRQEQNSASQTAPLVEDMVQDLLNTNASIRASEAYRYIFEKGIHDSASDALLSPQGTGLSSVLERAEENNAVSAVRVYVDIPENEDCFSDTEGYFAPLSQVRRTYWYGIFQGSHPTSLFCPPLYLSQREADSLGDCAYIMPMRMLTVDSGEVTCYLALYFQSSALQEILTDNLVNDGSLSYITNDRDAVITTSDSNLIGLYYVDYDSIRNNLMSSNSFIEKNITGNRVFVGFYYIESADWFMVTVLPNGPIMAKTLQMLGLFLAVCAISIIAGLLVALSLSRSLTRRISAVSRQMSLVKNDNPPMIMSESASVDEIGELVDSYNYMVRKINRLIAEQAKYAEELRISEFNSLQSQINPHFLYNTMDMINWKAQQGKKAETTAAIRDLSRFYKLTLSRKNTITTVGNEIEHATIYMRLQNMRFGNTVDFVVDIPDSMLDIKIPTLIFQPIIENSLLHGILEKESKTGTIVLTGWMESEAAVIMISDDGVGMTQEKLASLLTEKQEQTQGSGHIGVYNTHRRLQILFGAAYGLSYKSTPGQGTDVEIRIPRYEKKSTLLHPGSSADGDSSSDPLSLVAVSTTNTSGSPETVTPDKLSNDRQNFPDDILNVENFHNVFREFPQGGNIFLIAHYVNEPYPEHSHDYFELNYIYRGTLINNIDGRDIYMSAGDLVVMNRNARHSLIPRSDNCLLLNICISREFFRKSLLHTVKRRSRLGLLLLGQNIHGGNYLFYPLGQNRRFQVLLSSVLQIYSASRFRETPELEHLFPTLFSVLSETETFSREGPNEETLRLLSGLRTDGLLPLEKIAENLGVTVEYIQMHIKEYYGRTAAGILREKRMKYASELLSDKKISLYLVAEKCGYTNVSAFSDDFKHYYGTSPEEYREQMI